VTEKPIRHKNGKYALKNYTVTVTVDHYIEVRAKDPQDALTRAAKIATDLYGPGHNVTPVEAVEAD